MVHFDTGVKIDIFVPRGRSAARAFTHRTSIRMAPDATAAIWVAGPALIVIEKLRSFQKQDGTGELLERALAQAGLA